MLFEYGTHCAMSINIWMSIEVTSIFNSGILWNQSLFQHFVNFNTYVFQCPEICKTLLLKKQPIWAKEIYVFPLLMHKMVHNISFSYLHENIQEGICEKEV